MGSRRPATLAGMPRRPRPPRDASGDLGRALLRGVLAGGAGFAVYALAPVADGPLRTSDGLVVVASVLGFGLLVAGAAVRERRAGVGPDSGARIENLVAIILWAVAFFALVYFRLSLAPDQLMGIETRVDALYFTVSTLTTVGFGDIVAVGQAARAVVLVQMVFNISVLALAVRVLLAAVQRRRPAP
jgi:voltage-gated potassium channel